MEISNQTNNVSFDYLYLEPLIKLTRYVFILWNNSGKDTFEAIDEYLTNSIIRQKMDKGFTPFLNKGSKQVFNSINLAKCKDNQNPVNESIVYWLADIYTTLQWKYNIPSSFICDKIPSKTLAELYNPLHEMSINRACNRLYNQYLN